MMGRSERDNIEAEARTLLRRERQETLARIDAMTTDFDEIVAASLDSNIDDEHDPEGSTVAFERAQTTALITRAKAYLEDLDQALARLDAGHYSACERCGAAIGTERHAARPAVRTCVSCAALSPPDQRFH